MLSPKFSIYEHFPNQFNPSHYGAAKAGVIQLTKYYAALLAPHNITVNCVSPGPFPNENTKKHIEFVNQLSKNVPLGRVGSPEELKGIFVLLSSNASNYITGQNLIVDGGWSIW